MVVFGNILKELRTEFGLNQRQLAKMLNVTNCTVSSWEVSRTEPPFETLCEIADIFKVSLDYLLGRSEDADVSEPYQKTIKQNHRLFLNALKKIDIDSFNEKEVNLLLNTLIKMAEELKELKNT